MGHAGALLTEDARTLLHSLGRGVCLTEGCGALRAVRREGGRREGCPRCKRYSDTRPLAEGDHIPPSRRWGTGEEAVPIDADMVDAETVPADADELHDAGLVPPPPEEPPLQAAMPDEARQLRVLPDDFDERVRALPHTSIVWMPYASRAPMCEVTAALIEGLNAGDRGSARLELARTKLLLAQVPRGDSMPRELRIRFGLWRGGKFGELLERIEGQHAIRPQRKPGSAAATRVPRAHRLARGGARRKALQALTSEVAELTPDEQRQWAVELLPPAGPAAGPPLQPLTPLDVDQAAVDDVGTSPLEGVHFNPLGGSGPSGARPEHLHDMLACGRRRPANRLLTALRATELLADAGRLPDTWADVLLPTRVVFLKKRHGPKPRPVRVGELWRRVIAKNRLRTHAQPVRRAMVRAHQFAVLLPGGTEPLIHARRCFREAVVADASLGVWAELDVDVVNAFPSMEWPAVDQAMREEVPQLARWSEWCHRGAPITLPDGTVHRAGRGAEQGDPTASVQCGAVLAGARRRRKLAQVAAAGEGPSLTYDAWYADDGQVFARPGGVDAFLVALDAELAKSGCTRGEMPHAKSSVTLIGHPDALAALDGSWLTPYIARTCAIRAPNAATEVLGATLGSAEEVCAHFDATVRATGALHTAIETLCDPATELTLGRSCADVSRVCHLLRTAGDVIADGPVAGHDSQQQAFVERVLGGTLGDHALAQAALGVKAGGLGLRAAADVGLAAFVASRTEAAPIVEYIYGAMAAEGIPTEAARAIYVDQLVAARARLDAQLSEPRRGQVAAVLEDGDRRARERFTAILEARAAEAEAEDPDEEGVPRGSVVAGVGFDDPEHVGTRCVPRLQRRLAQVLDEERADAYARAADADGRDHDARRVRELSDGSVNHEWLSSLALSSRHTLEPDVFVDAVRLRLGAAEAATDSCRVCGRPSGVDAAHALCCAPGASTRGHNELRDRLLGLAREGDPHAVAEALGLLPAAPDSRPADVLTNAAGGIGLVALDVGIASPDSRLAAAHGDAPEAMRLRKHRHYAPHAADMRDAGLAYEPVAWSCWGREHEDTTKVLVALCRRAARRRGEADWRRVLRGFRADVGAILARRASVMWRACTLPHAAGGVRG